MQQFCIETVVSRLPSFPHVDHQPAIETFTMRCLYYQMITFVYQIITFVYLLQITQPLCSERDDRSSSPLLPIAQGGDLVRIFLL